LEQETKDEVVPQINFFESLWLHRIWSLVSYDKVEIMSAGSSVFINPEHIRFVFNKVEAIQKVFIISFSTADDNGNYFAFKMAYNSESDANTAIIQIQDLIRNLENYRYHLVPVRSREVEPPAKMTLWQRVKFIFNR